MGLYYRPTILPSDPDGLDHYFAHSEIALPMQLYLYDYESGENIFSWRPTDDQWWATGFNPEFTNPDPYDMTMICSVDFTDCEEMCEAFLTNYTNDEPIYVIFNECYETIWFVWQ